MSDADQLKAYLAHRDVPCPECGYNLHGVTQTQCPECGARLTLRRIKGYSPDNLTAWMFILMAWNSVFAGFGVFQFIIELLQSQVSRPVNRWFAVTSILAGVISAATVLLIRRAGSDSHKRDQTRLLMCAVGAVGPFAVIFLSGMARTFL